MEKELKYIIISIIIVFGLLILNSLVISQNVIDLTDSGNDDIVVDDGGIINSNLEDVDNNGVIEEGSDVIDGRDELGRVKEDTARNVAGIKNEIQNPFQNEVEIPEGMQFFARVLFGITESSVTMRDLLILMSLWLLFFITMTQLLKFSMILENGFARYLGAFIITCLIAITGIFVSILNTFYDYGFYIAIFAIILLLFLIWLFNKLERFVRNTIAEEQAMKIGLGIALMRIMAGSADDLKS